RARPRGRDPADGGDRRRAGVVGVPVPRQPPLQRGQGEGVRRVLILGGTAEARALAAALAADPGLHVVSSLAGRVHTPRLPVGGGGEGGFGGPDGLPSWLVRERIDVLVDATHPFAERMTASGIAASAAAGVPLLVLRRPGWREEPGDTWLRVGSLPAA